MIEHSCSSFEGPGVGLVQGVVQLVNTRVIPWSGTIHPRWITSPTEKIHEEETSRAIFLHLFQSYLKLSYYSFQFFKIS